MLRQIRLFALTVSALCLGGTLAHAQDADVYFGGGYANDKSANLVSTSSGVAVTSPSLNASFGKVGGDFMLNKKYGAGFEGDFQFSQANYFGVYKVRPTFYDVYAIYTPFSDKFKRVVPEIQGGIGGVHMTFNYNQTLCDTNAICQSSSQAVAAVSHFQVRVGVGLRFYATKHLFVRPQFDYHYVPNFTQYGSNSVTEFGAAVGWSFSEH